MEIPVTHGRDFTREDMSSTAGSVVVNEAFVRKYFPGEDPIGRRVKWAMRADDPQRPWLTIIGVVGNIRDFGLDSDINYPAVYMSYAHLPNPMLSRGMFLAIRTSSDPMLLSKSVRDRIWSIEKDAPIPFTSTLDQVVSDSVSTQRFRTLLLGLFAGLALLLAAVGVYGVMSYTVTQQTREIGIRMAIGAQQTDVMKLVLAGGLRLTAIGLVIGLGAAVGLTRVIEAFLFGVTPTDTGTFVAISLLLVVVAMLSCYIPARRASRIDPAKALRYE
jgi:putative ABC transport system permease protein